MDSSGALLFDIACDTAGICALVQEIGDVENWAQRIESDMHTIVEGLEYVHKGTPSPRTCTACCGISVDMLE